MKLKQKENHSLRKNLSGSLVTGIATGLSGHGMQTKDPFNTGTFSKKLNPHA